MVMAGLGGRRWWVFVVGVLCCVGMGIAGGIFYAGHLLSSSRSPQQADVGLVLAGNFGRAIYAADLYHQGFIQKIWISRPEREKGLVQMDELGVSLPRQEDISHTILIKKGVDREQIEFVGIGATSTINEARDIAALLPRRPEVGSILLITSRFHVRRAEAIFKKALEPFSGFQVNAVGTPYDGFVADRWWTDRESTRQVILESAKLVLFWSGREY